MVQSQLLASPLRPSGFSQFEGCISAPAAAAQHQSLVMNVNEAPPAFSSNHLIGQQESQSQLMQIAPRPNVSFSLPVGSVVHTTPNIRSISGDGAENVHPPNRQWRRNERRMQREQQPPAPSSRIEHSGLPSHIPDELMMQPNRSRNEPDDNDASFMRELQQALAANSLPSQSQSQLPLESIAAHSTLNWNASEFCPSQSPMNIREPRISVSN